MTRARSAATVFAIVMTGALVAPWLAPFDPAQPLDLAALKNSLPSRAHWLGTDPYSRDLLSRVLFGARTSMAVALLASATAVMAGTAWAAVSRLVSPAIGAAMMTALDIVRSVPRLLLMLAVVAVTGALGPLTLAVTVGLTAAPHIARLAHAQLVQLTVRDFSSAATALGASPWRVVIRHLLPHIVGPVTVAAVLLMADVMAFEAALSFLGLGVRSPNVSWGSMVQDALPYLNSAWWVAAVPCTCLLVTVLCTTQVADHLDSARISAHD